MKYKLICNILFKKKSHDINYVLLGKKRALFVYREKFISLYTSANQNRDHSYVYMKTSGKQLLSEENVSYQLRTHGVIVATPSKVGYGQNIKGLWAAPKGKGSKVKIFNGAGLPLLNLSTVCKLFNDQDFFFGIKLRKAMVEHHKKATSSWKSKTGLLLSFCCFFTNLLLLYGRSLCLSLYCTNHLNLAFAKNKVTDAGTPCIQVQLCRAVCARLSQSFSLTVCVHVSANIRF